MMKLLLKPLLIVLTLFGIPGMISACSTQQTLSIENAWARPALSGDNGAVYFEVDNPADRDDAITSVSSEVAAQVEFHESTMDSAGTMSMHPQHSIPVPAGGRVLFEPGGLHIMLVSLNSDLIIGESFQLSLHFENSGTQTINVEVKQP